MSAPILIFCYGNPSRGDDALGPLFLERAAEHLAAEIAAGTIELLSDFQLQVEHVLDLVRREKVLFVDAGLSCAEPFEFTEVLPVRDTSFTSHSLSPAAVLHAYEQTLEGAPPDAYILSMRGYRFELGEGLSPKAAANLDAALAWTIRWLANHTRP